MQKMTQKIHFNQSHNILIQDDDADDTTSTTADLSDKKFITSRCNDVFTRFARVIICIFVIVITLLIGTVLLHSFLEKNADNYQCNEEESRFCNKIIFSDENQIRTYDLLTRRSNFLYEDKNDITTFDVDEKTVYWSEENLPVIRILSQSHNITHSRKLKPQAIALDSLTKKLYVVDKFTGTLGVIDMNNQYFGIVMSDLFEPSDIVLDIQEGLMFITQHLQSIIRANLDGTNVTTIAKSQGVSAIALDYKDKKIFWAATFVSDDYGIISANYDGKNRTILAELTIPVRSLTYLNNQLFWLSSENWKRNASIWFCNLDPDLQSESCKNHTKLPLYFHKPKTIKTFVPQVTAEKHLSNPCRTNNGNCTDFCFASVDGTRTCACRVGYELDQDLQSCKKVSKFLMYVEKNYVRAIILQSKQDNTFRDAIIPTPFTVNFLSYRNLINFDYDVARDNFYYSDSSSIYLLKIMTEGESKNLVKAKTFDRINSLSFDQLSNNLYYSYTSGAYVEENSIMILHVGQHPDNVLQRTAATFDVSRDGNNPARYVTVIPEKGNVLYIKWDSGKDIHSISVNGSDRKSLHTVPYVATDRLILTVDHQDEMVYYAYSSDTKIFLYRANLQFEKVEQINETLPVPEVKSLYVYGEHLYISNSSTIWQVDKKTAKNVVRVVPSHDRISDKAIFGIKVYSMDVSEEEDTKNNGCAENNGECAEFCYAKPQKKCGCLDNKELQSDGRCFLMGS